MINAINPTIIQQGIIMKSSAIPPNTVYALVSLLDVEGETS